MSNTSKENAESPEEKRALLTRLLQKKASESKSFPLSHGQQALWFLYKLAPQSWAYNTLFTAHIRSDVDTQALRSAFQTLVSRHPSLRTTYTVRDGKPLQQHEQQEIHFEEIDARTWDGDELNNHVAEAAHRPFDLEQGPLLRVSLFTRSATDRILMLAIHHIASDFWSLLVLLDELRVLYPAQKAGTQALPPLALSYADYVRWQTEMLAGTQGARLWDYWQKQLAGELPVLTLPNNRPRPSVQTYRGASYSFKLTEELTQLLKTLAQAEKSTLYTTLLAAFQVLLYRYTSQEDILVGSPTAGRTRREFAEIVGYFVNLVVLRADLSGNPTFKTFLSQVRHTVLGAIAHQDYPFPLLVERLQPNRDPSRSPIFQVSFALQKPQRVGEVVELFAPRETGVELNLGGLSLEPFEIAQQEGQFDLTLEMLEVRKSLFGVFKYNTDLFDVATIGSMAGHFQTLLEGIVANPNQRLSDLPILSAEEHQQLLTWNHTQVDYPLNSCIHQLFAAQVERAPDAIAVVFGSDQLTYRELNIRSNKVAHYLQKLGVGSEALVGICVERSVELIVGLLGILKAGGAYVPLDPAYPYDRLTFMLEDAHVSVLLTQQHLVERLSEHRLQVVCLDAQWQSIAQQSEANPERSVAASHLAYVIYTSGSTGKPKGVAVEHHSLLNLVFWHQQAFAVSPKTRATQIAGVAFDACGWEVWPYLAAGASIHFPDEETRITPTRLRDWLLEQGITISFVPTLLLERLLALDWPKDAALRTLLTGGDKLQQRPSVSLPFEVVNNYGPTENTVVTTSGVVTASDRGEGVPTIGRPIANTQVYLLDRYLQTVPIGVPGELYIGGDSLARGYLNRPELNALVFIPHPFNNSKSNRLYKTGDLARYLADGNIEYLGRIDNQVKIRGFRIELAEIEAVLSQHPDVLQSVVIVREGIPGDQRLVAYIVPAARQFDATLLKSGNPPTEVAPQRGGSGSPLGMGGRPPHATGSPAFLADLRRFLKQKLPDYMVPSTFVMLDTLPLTPNGKVDHRALPAPEMASELSSTFVAPKTPIQEMLALIWADVLGVEQVGIHDNFFELGGHSLLATQLVSRVRTTFSVELPLRRLFEAPTVAELAECLETAVEQQLLTPPLLPRTHEQAIPLSFAQARLWFLDQLESGGAVYNIPAAVRLVGRLNVPALEQGLNETISRHEALRTNFITQDGQLVQVIAQTLNLSLSVVNLLNLPESECQRLATAEAQRPFDLATEPLVRATLLQLAEAEHILLLTMHHIISDGWSIGVLVKELALLYSALCNDLPSELPQLPIQYADFAIWQRQWLQGEVLEAQLSYWKQQLFNAPAVLELPTDRVRPAIQTFRGAHQAIVLPKELSKAVRALSQRQGVTLFMTLLAAFQTLLYRYTGQDDICVGSLIANRNRSETEQLIGLFVNTLVLRTNLSGNPSFQELLGRIREVALGAYAHQDLPFEQLVEALQPDRNLSHQPLFQVMFVLQNTPMPALELPGLTLSRLEMDSTTSKFDLTLSMSDSLQGLVGSLEYNTDLFNADTISRMLGHFQTLLEGIVANPSQRLADLPLLTPAEHQQLLVEWNHTQVDYPKNVCIHELFEAQVERSPDAVAVVFASQQLTYQALNDRANQVAHHLRSLGVVADSLVGLCLERSVEMVVGLLGILKAGGAYVPLDPAYPQKRLAFMLEDAQVSVLLTQQQLVKKLPDYQAHLVCLDTDWDANAYGTAMPNAKQSQENPVSEVTADNLAYVIYTSGSTGKPKGVAIEHHSTVALLYWARDVFAPEHLAGVLASTSICFDLSVFELFVPLSWGGKCILAENALDLPTLPAALDVTLINTVPSAISELLRVDALPSSVRTVNLAGEPLQNRLVQQLYQRDSVQQVFNLYGPSEATTYSTFSLVKKGDSIVTIGRAIANTQIYLLDRHLQLVPIGVPGELYIGGAGLARGYLNRPELNALVFIPHPFNNSKCNCLYKTGDLARYLADGNIEYLGRIDNQVKIRGFRIELGEIEAVLSQHPALQDAIIACEDVPGNKRLVAYVVVNQSPVPAMKELHQFLKQKLPDYMVPSIFVMLDTLPLTPNGKIDRRALPAPEMASELSSTFVAPKTPIQEMLALIWADVLGVEQVGIHDNFFELGGHSLLATQLVSRVRTTFTVELPLRRLFEAPTVKELAECIESAIGIGQQLLAPPLLPRTHEQAIPLSFAQARLWFLDQLESGGAVYNIPAAVRLAGRLNVPALEQGLNKIISRHEALRTNFTTQNGQPVQVIAQTLNLTLPVVDLLNLPKTQRESECQRLATAEAQRPFDLATEPLVRATLLQLAETEHILLLTMHHIISDGWSMGVLLSESSLYSALCNDLPSELPQLPIQYADFAIWQRQWLQGEVLEAQLSYWKQQLFNAPAVLELPTDRVRPAIQTFRGAHQAIVLPKELSEAVHTLSQRQGVTLFMTLLAAFQTLLYRYTGQTDICVGTPIANRNRAEIESLIGLFVNTLVLRTDLGGNPTFVDVLSRIREVALAAYAHQDLPFEQLVEELQPARELSHTPLFQVMFVLQNTPMPSLEFLDLTATPLAVETGTARFDLTLLLENTSQGLSGLWEYNTDLFDAATIARMAAHFQTLLEGIVVNPNQHLSALPLLNAADVQQLLVEWNNTEADYPLDACIHQLFAAQVERTPDAIAVVFDSDQLTYRELNSRSNKIARYLQKLGVGSEVLVGICLERSVELIVGLLGILKAGGAYVPLDPSYPGDRLLFMLEDAEVSLVISHSSLVHSFGQMTVVCLDYDREIIAQQSDENLLNNLTGDNLAYVMYTSGSTGKPKGVAIPHKAVNRLVFNTNYVKLDPADKIAQVSNTSFDAATFEIWGALLHGAQLVGISKDIALSPHDLALQLHQKGISVLFLTTALFQQVARVAPQAFSSLRYLLFGGEVVEPRLVQEVLKNGLPKQLLHVYGPTESTTFSSYYWVQDVPEEATSIPIGRPIANTQIYLLDEQLQPVPIGVPGELYIGGDGLARGYLNRPELNALVFIPHPFNNSKCNCLYKTGDLARYLADGNIEYLGRIDNQVKIRGFRIELAEIEAVLSQHPDVLQSVVIVREGIPGDRRLVAYIVPAARQFDATLLKSGNPPTEVAPQRGDSGSPLGMGGRPPHATGSPAFLADLRRFLKQKLPDYMVPYAFVMLDTLPLTANGKVDRRALPAPDEMACPESQTFVAPRNPIQEMLALIWADVLGVEQVGIDHNFFELGGHSLLATQLIGRVREAFSIELPLRSFFESPTVAELSEVIETVRQTGEGLQAPAIEPTPRYGDIPLSFAQARLWFLNQLEGGSATYNIPVALRLTGFINLAALEQAIGEIVQRHEVLRTTFQMVDGVPVQAIAPTSTVPLSVVDLQVLPEGEQFTEVRRLAIEEARAIFDLTNGPLLRVTLLRLSEKSHVLLLVMHHIISDGWSLGIFVRELSALYEAFSNRTPSPLPALPVQYADFTRWQQWLSRKVLETQLNYWQQQLAGAPPLLELPTDRPHPPVQTFQGSIEPFKLDRDLTRKLKSLSQQTGATLFMTLLAAFVTLLSRYSGQEDIVVGSPIANRYRSEVEGLIGFFANTLALRTDLSGDPTFRELLCRVREVTMGAYAHQDLPFEKLVEALQPERALSRNPLFQVVFALQNAPIPALELPGLKLELWEFDFGTVRFDLEVHLREVSEGLSGHFVYSTDLYDAATIARMAGHFQTLLEGIAANSEQWLSELSLLTEAERQQLLVSSNGVQADNNCGDEKQMLAKLDGLSDEEVNALLNQMLAE